MAPGLTPSRKNSFLWSPEVLWHPRPDLATCAACDKPAKRHRWIRLLRFLLLPRCPITVCAPAGFFVLSMAEACAFSRCKFCPKGAGHFVGASGPQGNSADHAQTLYHATLDCSDAPLLGLVAQCLALPRCLETGRRDLLLLASPRSFGPALGDCDCICGFTGKIPPPWLDGTSGKIFIFVGPWLCYMCEASL